MIVINGKRFQNNMFLQVLANKENIFYHCKDMSTLTPNSLRRLDLKKMNIPGWVHCAVFLGNTQDSQSASLRLGVQMDTGECYVSGQHKTLAQPLAA